MIDLNSERWRSAVEASLRARVVPLASTNESEPSSLTIFRRGPWQIGYVDFIAGSEGQSEASLPALMSAARALGVDVVRFQGREPVPMSRRWARYPIQDCRIENLQRWEARAIDKGRRTSNRRVRTALSIRRARRDDGAAMHRLYVETLRGHGGTAHYSASYFEAIAESAALVATYEGQLVGFVCSGFLGGRGLYLHGAQSPAGRRHHASDLLFLEMLCAAKAKGLKTFDFLASPQPGLLAYKQAWGGRARNEWVCDCPLTVLGSAFSAAYRVHRAWAARRVGRGGKRSTS